MKRLLFFGDSNSPVSSLLLERVIEISSASRDLELVAVCDCARHTHRFEIFRTLEHLVSFYLRRWFSSNLRQSTEMLLLPRLVKLCRTHGIPIIIPPNRDINHPDLKGQLQEFFSPQIGFSGYCPQILGSDLLNLFDSAVNYHNGLLPKYRGLRASAWSLYYRETESGFTFHYMTERIDDGRILLQRSLPVAPGVSYREVEINKALLARSCLDEVLEMVLTQEVGTEPTGPESYFSSDAWRRLVTIEDPGKISAAELQHRIDCFEILNLKIEGEVYPVTEVVEDDGGARLGFRTSDGASLRPKRFLYLPYSLYRLYRLVRPEAT